MDQDFYVQSKNWIIDLLSFCMTNEYIIEWVLDSVFNLLGIFLFKLEQYDDMVIGLFPIIVYCLLQKPNKQILPNIPNFGNSYSNLLQNVQENNFKNITNVEKVIGIVGNYIQKMPKIIYTSRDFYGKQFLEHIFDIVDLLIKEGFSENIDIKLIYAV